MRPDPAYRIRAIGPEDLGDVGKLRDLAGPGFTSLAVDDDVLRARLAHVAASFAADIDAPGPERYLLGLEHLESGRLVGLGGVKALIGWSPPFFNFRVLKIAQASQAAVRRFDMHVLILVNEFSGSSEVGTLFVHADHRAAGVGRAMAQSRYMLIATAPARFCDTIVSELRGVSDAGGRSPFWEHLGRRFFRMEFPEADRLSASTDNQFILDLMPKYPIYADLLPEEAQAVIGQCHREGEGARRLLEWEGFRYANVVDIFDAGPLMTAPRDHIRTVREARAGLLRVADALPLPPRRSLIARAGQGAFVCVPTVSVMEDGEVWASPAAARALGAEDGEPVWAWIDGDG